MLLHMSVFLMQCSCQPEFHASPNTDYRILAGVLATHLQNVISDLIGPEQVAYIKGRFVGTNIRLIQDIFQL